MATSIDVNIKLGSLLGATQVYGGVRGGRPNVQSTLTLNGTTASLIVGDIPLLSVDALPVPFQLYPGLASPQQDVFLYNIGTAVVTVTNALYTLQGARPIFYWTETTALYNTYTNTSSTITINPGESATFKIAYIGTVPGDYSNSLSFISNSVSGAYKVNTGQITSDDEYGFSLSTTTSITTTTVLGQRAITEISLIGTKNGLVEPEQTVNFTTVISSPTPGWSTTTATNKVFLIFDPDYVNNSTGTYHSTLTVTSNNVSHIVSNTATINIDFNKYRNIATWMSPAASYNSIIGISFDIFNNEKILTIGLGVGGDNTPQYGQGGNIFAQLSSLGIGTASIEPPYPYWGNVYSFTLTDTPATYLSGVLDDNDIPLYAVKTTAGLNYADYFGYEQGQGSVFIVEHDGTGNVAIKINNLRELSGDETFDSTLANITRAFYYYSSIDTPQRYYQLEQPIIDGTLTHVFRGFTTYYSTVTSSWAWYPETSIVPLPT